jgi:hypothetical protein
MLDHVYEDFTIKVAEARGMTREQVHELARGRVWTGRDAYEGGLVDELGGLETAVRLAREKAGLPTGTHLRSYPQTNPLERMMPAESSEDRAATPQLRLASWGPLAQLSAELGLSAAGPLVMPGGWPKFSTIRLPGSTKTDCTDGAGRHVRSSTDCLRPANHYAPTESTPATRPGTSAAGFKPSWVTSGLASRIYGTRTSPSCITDTTCSETP